MTRILNLFASLLGLAVILAGRLKSLVIRDLDNVVAGFNRTEARLNAIIDRENAKVVASEARTDALYARLTAERQARVDSRATADRASRVRARVQAIIA